LTRALTKTDIRKLLSADSEVEKAMAGLLPESMENKLKQTSDGGGDITAISKDEMSSFVETMKAKDNVKAIMNALRQTAPEIYTAMVGERDLYMAKGLDELGSTLNGKVVDNTVAVVGMKVCVCIVLSCTYVCSVIWLLHLSLHCIHLLALATHMY